MARDKAQADGAAIDATLRDLAEAFTRRDVERVVSLFAADAIALPPNEAARFGRDAVREWHEAVFRQFFGTAELTSQEIVVENEYAYVRGHYAMQLASRETGEITDEGKFIMILRREGDGSWKIARNIWNSDQPPAAG